VFFNDEYQLDEEQQRSVDASLCRIVYGKKDTTLSAIHAGDTVFIVSWDDMAKDVPEPDPDKSIDDQVNNFQWPMIADEIYILKKKEELKSKEKVDTPPTEKKTAFDWKGLLRIGIYSVVILVVGFLLFPSFWYLLLLNRVRKSDATKIFAENVYRLSLYVYHMSGVELKTETSAEYAQRADEKFKSEFSHFVLVYLKLKYSQQQLSESENLEIRNYNATFRNSLNQALSFGMKIKRWFNVLKMLRYFQAPEPQHVSEGINTTND
jgi:hypothetical protein